MIKHEKTGESRCCALVTFDKLNEDEDKFLEKTHNINGRCIAMELNTISGNKTVLVSGAMVKYLTGASVVEFLSKFGKVKSIAIENTATQSRIVEFETSEAAEKALGKFCDDKIQQIHQHFISQLNVITKSSTIS